MGYAACLVPADAVMEHLLGSVSETPPIKSADLKQLGGLYWRIVALGIVLTLARFREALLILRAQTMGLPIALVPLVLILMNIVYALSAYPIGALSDRMNRGTLLVPVSAYYFIALVIGLWRINVDRDAWSGSMGPPYGYDAGLACHGGRRSRAGLCPGH